MRSVFHPQVVHLVVEKRMEMASRYPSGVDQKFQKGDIRIETVNRSMAEVVAYDHLLNDENIHIVLDNV